MKLISAIVTVLSAVALSSCETIDPKDHSSHAGHDHSSHAGHDEGHFDALERALEE